MSAVPTDLPDYVTRSDPPEKPLDGPESPNSDIDTLIKHLIKRAKSNKKDEQLPPDTIVKILNTAINWEKVKHKILETDEGFDPEALA